MSMVMGESALGGSKIRPPVCRFEPMLVSEVIDGNLAGSHGIRDGPCQD